MSRRDRLQFDPVVEAARNWAQSGWPGGGRLMAALSLIRVESLVRDSASAELRRWNLTYAKHELLAVLYFSRRGELPFRALGRRLMVHPTSITTTVDSLEQLKMVERCLDPVDRRVRVARITDAGRRAMEESSVALLESKFGLESLSEAEAHQLFRLLAKVRAAAGDFSESP